MRVLQGNQTSKIQSDNTSLSYEHRRWFVLKQCETDCQKGGITNDSKPNCICATWGNEEA